MLPSADATLPAPVPPFAIVSVYFLSVKVAVTCVAAVIVTWQVPVPEQPPPDQPPKSDCVSGVAVSVTIELGEYWCEHVVPQLMLPSFDVTVPVPLPPSVTMSELLSANDACTVVSAVGVNVQSP